jgi:hypothetical protein
MITLFTLAAIFILLSSLAGRRAIPGPAGQLREVSIAELTVEGLASGCRSGASADRTGWLEVGFLARAVAPGENRGMPMLARLTPSLLEERRCSGRRERPEGPVIASQHAFEREERLILRELERRRERRREEDVTAALRGSAESAP